MCLLLTLMTVGFDSNAADTEYDPLHSSDPITIVDAEFQYSEADRTVPLRIYLPKKKKPAPVILFSHGLGGSRDGARYLGNHWAGRGYVVVMMQHAGSDSEVWKNVPVAQRLTALKKAANAESFHSRVADVPATIDQLESWNRSHRQFAGRFDLSKIGMSGHSYGAVTTQAVSGQSYGRLRNFTDSRILAAIAFSPSLPALGNNQQTFAHVTIPWLLMTGTKDKSVIGRTTPEDRRKVFQQLPHSGIFYELVLDGAEHSAFSDRPMLRREHRNPNHHKAIRGISTAFWDSCLQNSAQARTWLDTTGPRHLLDQEDVWQKK